MRLTISIIVSGLCDYRQICAKASILGTLMQQAQDDAACAKYACSAVEKQYNELRFKKEIIECWLQLLPGVERFLVQTHLVDGLDWAKTIAEYDKRWGIMNGRSERTLKRIQARAIKRIVECMNEIEALTGSDLEKKNSSTNVASSLTSE